MVRKKRQQKKISQKRRAEKKLRTQELDREIRQAVDRVVKEYGSVLRKLGKR